MNCLPIREEVWNRTYGTNMRPKCIICCRNTLSPFNFETGHIISKKRGGNDTVSNMKAICSPCNKSMGVKNMKHYFANVWRGRKYPKKSPFANDQKEENPHVGGIINRCPPNIHEVKEAVVGPIKIQAGNLIKLYLQFGQFMQPRAHMSDCNMWYDYYLSNCDQIQNNPQIIKTLNISQCVEKFKSTKTWHDSAGFYELNKYMELLRAYQSEYRKFMNE